MENRTAHFALDPDKDYGFTVYRAKSTKNLPEWDLYRLTKVKEVLETCESVLDFGAASRGLTELLADSTLGKVTTVDINPEINPDVVADICALPFEDNSVDGIICASILEHVYNPFLAVIELHRVLKPGGKMFVFLPWMYPYHVYGGEFEDYYRFSEDGIRYLFRDFSEIEVVPVRGRLETVLNFVPQLSKRSRFIRVFGPIIRRLDRKSRVHTSGYSFSVVK